MLRSKTNTPLGIWSSSIEVSYETFTTAVCGPPARTIGAGARAPADRFIVLLVTFIPKSEIVHGALTSGENTKSTVERLGNHLRNLGVPCNDRSWVASSHTTIGQSQGKSSIESCGMRKN